MKNKQRAEQLLQLEEEIGINFRNLSLVDDAFTHRSYIFEHSESKDSNERLEFLGDAVVGMAVCGYLYQKFPQFDEGELSHIKSKVVSRSCLARKARKLNLGRYLLIGKGEETTGGRQRPSLLTNAFEALIGAIYLDQGWEVVSVYVIQQLEKEIDIIVEGKREQDFKTLLQEYTQAHMGEMPFYKVISQNGPEHRIIFTVAVILGGKVYGQGKGRSKKKAEQFAAQQAWEKLSNGKVSPPGG
jgi:ribonuclease-3